MPTENERKFVLRPECENTLVAEGSTPILIKQGYLLAARGITVRVRQAQAKGKPPNYLFTLKATVNGRVVELEYDISRRDFHDLWDISLNKLEKIRYKLNHKSKGWVADFFKDHDNQTYFAMAECEMPEGQKTPTYFPPEVTDNLLFEVPATDTRFSSKMLADIRFARKLLKEIAEGSK